MEDGKSRVKHLSSMAVAVMGTGPTRNAIEYVVASDEYPYQSRLATHICNQEIHIGRSFPLNFLVNEQPNILTYAKQALLVSRIGFNALQSFISIFPVIPWPRREPRRTCCLSSARRRNYVPLSFLWQYFRRPSREEFISRTIISVPCIPVRASL